MNQCKKAILTKDGSEVHFFWVENSEEPNVTVARWSKIISHFSEYKKHESTRELTSFLARLLWRGLIADGYKIEVLV